MMTLLRETLRLTNDRRGVSALEHGLIACTMSGFLIGGFAVLWSPMAPSFTIIGDVLISTTSAGF